MLEEEWEPKSDNECPPEWFHPMGESSTFVVGGAVEAWWRGPGGNKGRRKVTKLNKYTYSFFSGIVKTIGDDSLSVEWDDSGLIETVEKKYARAVKWSELPKYKVGDSVIARFKKKCKWYAATIQAIHGNYCNIKYTQDGEFEADVRLDLMTPLQQTNPHYKALVKSSKVVVKRDEIFFSP